MTKSSCNLISLLLVIVLAAGLAITPANAGDNGGDEISPRPIRLYATAYVGPIGKMESYGAVAAGAGRDFGERPVWAGDLIQAPVNGARVSLDAVGQITLKEGAIARFTTKRIRLDDGSGGYVLVASMASGEMNVRLSADAEAYVEAGGSVLTSSRGARFDVSLGKGELILHTVSGTVRTATQAPERRYKISAYGRGLDISVSARSSREIQVVVTDEHDKPVPDVPVVFALSQAIGSLGGAGQAAGTAITVTTGPQGIATTTFTAASAKTAGSITATVSGTNTSVTGNISVSTAVLSTTTIGIIAGVAAAGAVGGAIAATRGGSTPPHAPISFGPPGVKP
jgi:hypothetical protein